MEFSANQIAGLVNGTVEGDGNVMVHTFAKIEEGHKGAISFLANPKYTHHIYTTNSSIVLVKRDFVAEQEVKATLIHVDDPYATLAMLLNMVNEFLNPNPLASNNLHLFQKALRFPKMLMLVRLPILVKM